MSDKAISQLQRFFDDPSADLTKLDVLLFQLFNNAIGMSPFIALVVEQQADKTLNCARQLYPLFDTSNKNHNKEELEARFSAYIEKEINQIFFKPNYQVDQTRSDKNKPIALTTFIADYQSQASMMSALRQLRRRLSAALAMFELNHRITNDQAVVCQSIVAEKLIYLAYQWSYASLAESFGVAEVDDKAINLLILAMGKLGGRELNFSSDVDLIFFYSHGGETQGGRRSISHNQFFNRIGVLSIKLLDEVTSDGFVYRVDMRLRPYGDSGSLVMSVAQAEDYYQEQGRDWERFAMVRARLISGTKSEQIELQNIIKPFAFRRYIDYGVIDALRNMKQMIQQEVRRRGLVDNIKLGAGGIREVEFMVQSLQLIRGGRAPRLQQPSVVKVLPLIEEENLLQKSISDQLLKHYRFLRQTENYIQIFEEKQTQTLPQEQAYKNNLALLMGYSCWDDFYHELQNIMQQNHNHFNELFGESEKIENPVDDFYLQLSQGFIQATQLKDKYSIELSSAEAIVNRINVFIGSTMVKTMTARGAKRLKSILPILLNKTLEKKQSLQSLNSLFLVLKAILKRTVYLDLLYENHPVLEQLVDLVSRSDWIAERLSEYPILLDELLYPTSLYHPLKKQELKSELTQKLLRADEGDQELMLDSLREFKQINELRVAAALISNSITIEQVGSYLTQISEVILEFVYQYSLKRLFEKYKLSLSAGFLQQDGLAQAIGFSMIAYGKLGGNELGFSSDLDLVFLFDEKQNKIEISDFRFYTRLAQKIIHFLSTHTRLGILYEVDMRLRPSGNSGLLVSHIEAFDEYQKQQAWTWEHQALVRARAIVGHKQLNRRFNVIRYQVLCQQRDRVSLRNDVKQMREKMRQQLETSDKNTLDLKQCAGGLVDIEFITQYLTLLFVRQVKKYEPNSRFIPTNNILLLVASKALADLNNHDLNTADLDVLIEAYSSYLNEINQSVILNFRSKSNIKRFENEREDVKTIWEKIFECR